MLVDNSKVIAQRAAHEGCTVVWLEYEAMPHCFLFNFNLPQTDDTFERWANFCSACVERPYHSKTEGSRINYISLSRVNIRPQECVTMQALPLLETNEMLISTLRPSKLISNDSSNPSV